MLIVICTLVTIAIRPVIPKFSDSSNLGCVAIILKRSKNLMENLHRSGDQPLNMLEQMLRDSTYSLESHTKDDQTQSFWIRKSLIDGNVSPQVSGTKIAWWHPLASRKPMKAIRLALPLVLIVALETTYQISQRSHSLGDIMESEYLHYAWAVVPALIITAVKILLQTVAFPIQLLDPFRALKEGQTTRIEVMSRNYLSMNAPVLCFRSAMNRRYGVVGTALTAIFTPFLTIVVSGLFDGQYVPKVELVNVALADQLVVQYCTPWQQSCLTAANLLVKEDVGYPEGTYSNILYPGLATFARNTSTNQSTGTFNETSLFFEVPVYRIKMNCKVMDESGFRYTLDVNGSNYGFDGLPWTGGADQYYLKFTHTDLAGCNWCTQHVVPGAMIEYCKAKFASLGIYLSLNSTFFSAIFDAQWQVNNVTLMDPAAWSNSSELSSATENPTTSCPEVMVVYGPWDKSSANITGIACWQVDENVQVNLTYDLPQRSVSAVQVDEQSLSSHRSRCNLFDFASINEYLVEDGSGKYPNLITATLNGSDASTTLTSANASLVADRLSSIYETFVTQYLNDKRQAINDSTAQALIPGTLVNANRQRLYQNEVSTRILEGLLTIIWICTVVAFTFSRSRKVVHKNPCSIAAQASLFADSEMLHTMPETIGDGKALRSLEAQGYVVSLGWRGQDERNQTYGIDIGRAGIALV